MTPPSPRTFLVFSGGNDRAIISFLRALNGCGQRAAIVARANKDLILKSKYRDWVVHIRKDHALSVEVFQNGLEAARNSTGEKSFVVLPSTEYFNMFLLGNREEIENLGCMVPLVDRIIYALLSEKRSSIDFFKTAGFQVPNELDGGGSLRHPVVAKPKVNVSRDGRSLYPQLLITSQKLEDFLSTEDLSEYFFQEHVGGQSIYLMFYLPRDGSNPITWSQCNYLQQPNGKSILLAKSARFHQTNDAKKIIMALSSLGFWGLGMVELMISEEGGVFIEMNPRPWGPMQLCVDACPQLLECFIGEWCFDQPSRFVTRGAAGGRSDSNYGWLNGLVETLVRGNRPVPHGYRKGILTVLWECMNNDVYLRRDSWRCFFAEMSRVVQER